MFGCSLMEIKACEFVSQYFNGGEIRCAIVYLEVYIIK